MSDAVRSSRRVLVIDPSAMFRLTIAKRCTALGADVILEPSLIDGISVIEARPPDAIIVARMLGGLPGDSLVAALRASPIHEHIPVAILTSDEQIQTLVEAARPDRVIARDASLGDSVQAFLAKAFQAPEVAETQRELLENDSPDATLTGRRVVVVDDMESMCRLLGALLKRQGALVEQFVDAPAAVAALLEGPAPDLVIIDHEMPGMSGSEALLKLRGAGFAAPTLLCSGHDDEAFARTAIDQGFDGVVPKCNAHRDLTRLCLDTLRRAA